MKDDMVSDDTALIKRAKASFLKHLGSEVLMAKALEEIAVLMGSPHAHYQAISREGQMVGAVMYPHDDTTAMPYFSVINEHIGEHPLFDPLMNPESAPRPVKISDFVSLETFQATDIYKEAYRHLGWNFQICVGLWDRSGILHSMSFNRTENDFDERDRNLLQNLFPPFLKALRCNHLIDERLNQLRNDVALTLREAQILHWIAEGKSNFDVAAIIGLSIRTVDTHCANLFRKLNFKNRAAAIRYVSVVKRLTFDDPSVLSEAGN